MKISKACAKHCIWESHMIREYFSTPVPLRRRWRQPHSCLEKELTAVRLSKNLFWEDPYPESDLRRALLESMLVLEKQVVVSVVSRKEMEFSSSSKRSGGIVAQLADKRCGSGDFLHEDGCRGMGRSAFRGQAKVNVAVANCSVFCYGGGHVRAAGVTMKGSVLRCDQQSA